jgi:Xaa-Pro aminopeptidase
MSEFNRQRAKELIDRLSRDGFDALLLFPGPNIGYYTGFSIGLSERLAAALLPMDGKPLFVINELEGELRGMKPWFRDKVTWREQEDPVKVLADTIRGKGLSDAKIGVPEEAPWGWINKLHAALPDARLVDASDHIGYVRMIKTSQELEWIKDACSAADETLETGFNQLHTGMTESELSDILTAEMQSLGGGQTFMEVLFGERAALPHGEPSDSRLAPGDAVLVDMGCTINNYWSDITRTIFYGEPSLEHTDIYKTVLEANAAAFKAIKPGARCDSVDEAARKVIEDAGYGKYFIHRLGHGVGLQIHEPPYIVSNNTQKLEPGMVFSDEPGIYIVGDIGVRIEDIVACTKAGCERLTKFKRDLITYPVKK